MPMSTRRSGGGVRHLVWVYGTLKKGFFNHIATGLSGPTVRFVGPAATVQRLPLLTLTCYNVPFLLDAPGNGVRVHGEVYDVDAAMLTKLDKLEGHPKFYTRRPLSVRIEGGRQIEAHGYLMPEGRFRPDLLELPAQSFDSSYRMEDHRKYYVPPGQRPPGAREEIIAAVKK